MVLGIALGVLASAAGAEDRQLLNLSQVPLAQRNPVALEKVWPAQVGEASVCLWKDDKTAAFSVTIDDNTKPDHDWWLEQGRKYNFHFTWFIITGNIVSGKNPGFSGTWADFQKLLDAGHDVQSHTLSHRNKDANLLAREDYETAARQINENLKGTRCLTMAYPGGGLANDPKEAAQLFAGARGTRDFVNFPSAEYLETFSISGPGSSLTKAGEKGSWASIRGVAQKDPGFPKSYRGWYCIHFHGVQHTDALRASVMEPALKLFDYVKENEADFWVALFREIVLYGQERDTATLKAGKVEGDQLSFTLTDRMLDDWYSFPLTVKVRVPAEWQGISATQNNNVVAAQILQHEGGTFALVQAVPDRGEVLLRRADAAPAVAVKP